MADPADIIWLQALRNGDENALRSIFDRYYTSLLGAIYRILPDEDACKDLAQEVMVELWRRREDMDIHTSLGAYLRRAAVNKALNYLKSNRRIQLEENDAFAEAEDSSVDDIAIQEKRQDLEIALYAAIERLPEKCRIVFSLSRFENRSHKEIAEQLGISVKTIENQITKAMKMLREALIILMVLSPVVILWLKTWAST